MPDGVGDGDARSFFGEMRWGDQHLGARFSWFGCNPAFVLSELETMSRH